MHPDPLADHAPDAKKPRLEPLVQPDQMKEADERRADVAAAADAAPASTEAGSPHTLVAVPVVGDQIGGDDLLPALQQLLSVYQVEYWALLEELRAKHNSVEEAAGAAATPAKSASTASTLQQLWQSASTQAEPDAAAQHSTAQQQPQQDGPGPVSTSFAAAAQPYGDQRCGFASDTTGDHSGQQPQQQQPQLPVPSLQQAEQLLQQLPAGGQDVGAVDPQQLKEWRQRFQAVAPSVAGLEQLASAATMQYMDAQGGLACFCGQAGRWVLRRSAASIGRSTDAKGDVDIDLGKAAAGGGVGGGGVGVGVGHKVSRLQAQLLLTADGQWSLHNTGRAPLGVNGQQVPRGSSVPLSHLSVLDVAGLPLLFMVNSMAVQRAVARSVHLTL